MGQKISPSLFRAHKRLSNTTNQSEDASNLQTSVWFASPKNYSKYLLQDKEIRDFIRAKMSAAGLAEIIIRRFFKKVEITLFVTKPGVIIGRSGATINKLKEDLIKKFALPADLRLDIQEYKDPFRSAKVVAQELSDAIKRGMAYRRLAKSYLEKIRYAGVLGSKIIIKGRLNGAEIARAEKFESGSVPTHTIDANIDFYRMPCKTKAGIIGIRVWLYKGDKFKNYTPS
jgi:small subunit ribosomal protein S3